jgi:hypothetical protein
MSKTNSRVGRDRWRPADLHYVSWVAGAIIAATLLALGPPRIFAAYAYEGFIDLTESLMLLEPLAIIASTVYAVERLMRRRAPLWQFSLKELLIAVATICVVVSVGVHQHRLTQRLQEAAHTAPVTFVYPPLIVAPWYLRLPLFFGVLCLAYTSIRVAIWAIGMVIWWMNPNREHGG